MARLALLLFALVGCSAPPPVAETRMQLTTEGGLGAGDVGSAMVLVLNGSHPSCDEALAGASPLDDPDLEVLQHALFTVDGSAKHLSIPAGEKLVFYVEAFGSSDGTGSRVGRGCTEATLKAGQSTGVSITITADQ